MQFVVAALHAIRCCVGDALATVLPANGVAFRFHQGDEFLTVPGEAHAIVDGIDETELPAFTLCGSTVLPCAHTFALLF